MTREEAIKYLIRPVQTSTQPQSEYLKQQEAYQMAIETLAKDINVLYKDCISRQDAIDAVHHSIFDFFNICEDDDESPITHKDIKLLELNKAICNNIKQLPSAQRWIQCKDCKFYVNTFCDIDGRDVPEDWYCADAEKRREK